MSLKLFTQGHTTDSQTFQFKVWPYFASGSPGSPPAESGRDFTLRPTDIDKLLNPTTTSRHGKRSTSSRRQRLDNNKESKRNSEIIVGFRVACCFKLKAAFGFAAKRHKTLKIRIGANEGMCLWAFTQRDHSVEKVARPHPGPLPPGEGIARDGSSDV